MIEGTFRIWRGDEVLNVGPGGVALLFRHQINTFKNIGTGTGRLLTVIQPAAWNTTSRRLPSVTSETTTRIGVPVSRLSSGWKFSGRRLPELRC